MGGFFFAYRLDLYIYIGWVGGIDFYGVHPCDKLGIPPDDITCANRESLSDFLT